MAASPAYSKATLLVARLTSGMHERKTQAPGEIDASASRLFDFCPRETALAAKHRIVRERAIFANLKYMFVIGQAVHDAFQNYIMGPLGLIYGAWRCHECATLSGAYPDNRVRMPAKCPKCRTRQSAERGFNFSYVEDEIVDATCGFVSHPDGYDDKGNIWEFKSIGGSFANKPKAEHMVQVQANMHVQHIVRSAPVKCARLVYIEKSALGVLDGVHEFQVPYDRAFAAKHYAKALELAQFFIDGTLPKMVCESTTCARADRCGVRAFCAQEKP